MSKFYMLCATAGLIIVLIGVMSLILRAANWASKNWASKEGDKQMRRLEQARKKLAETNKKKEDVKPCRHCGQSSFDWDFILMIKTCKNDKCGDVSGVM